MLVNVVPPSVLTCHCTVSVLPLALAVERLTLCPALIVWLAGCVRTKSTFSSAGDVVAVPELLVKTASYSFSVSAAVAVKL